MACVITVSGSQPRSGKTTVAVNLAASLVLEGHSCMLIDLGAGASASRVLGVSLRSYLFSAGAVLEGKASLRSVRLPTASGIDLVAGYQDTALPADAFSQALPLLREQLGALGTDYRFAVLDCSANIGPVESLALTLAEQVVIVYCPGQADGRNRPTLPRLQYAYVTGAVAAVANKVLPDWSLSELDGQGRGSVPSRPLGSVRYAPELPEMYWRGLPPVQTRPETAFAQDIQGITRSLLEVHPV
ncbi:MAG: AAA family ATPase [Anaerolineales bacterium]|nr:AAA family ATPase [Anaerolineales bacterium]